MNFAENRHSGGELEERMEQLGLISAVLGGFAFTFLSALLPLPSGNRLLNTLFTLAVLTSAMFFICALGWSLISWSQITVSVDSTSYIPPGFEAKHRLLSMLFIGGIVLLTLCLGLAGWIRSRVTGAVTTIIAAIALAVTLNVLGSFVS